MVIYEALYEGEERVHCEPCKASGDLVGAVKQSIATYTLCMAHVEEFRGLDEQWLSEHEARIEAGRRM